MSKSTVLVWDSKKNAWVDRVFVGDSIKLSLTLDKWMIDKNYPLVPKNIV